MSHSQRSADTSFTESVGQVKTVQILYPEYPEYPDLLHKHNSLLRESPVKAATNAK